MPLTDRDHFDSAAQTCPYVVGRTLAEKERAELQSEIDSLRLAIRRLADQDATLSVCNGNVTVTMDWTLTDAEREAIERGICSLVGVEDLSADAGTMDDAAACTLRELLERLK